MSSTTGVTTMIRLVLRRDRLRLTLWVLGIVGLCAASAATVVGSYDTPREIATYAAAGESAASRITSGRQVALDTIGGIVANEITMIATLGVALMVVFTVIRHTRAEEESGAAELLRSGVLGRHAATVAALTVAVAASVLVGGLLVLVLLGNGLDPTGSVAFGSSVALLGMLFAGIAAAAAQVTVGARGALSIAGGLVGAAYVVRGVGALGDNALYWLSPFGWAQAIDAFGDERWWLLAVLAVAVVVGFALAAVLESRRDAGAGLIQPRPGAARASRLLGSSAGLALRSQRGAIIGWAVGMAALAAIFASVIPEVPELLEGNPEMAQAFGLGAASAGDALIDAFLGYVHTTLGVVAVVFGVSSALRVRQEEESGRMEALLATDLTRSRTLTGGLVVTLAGLVLLSVATAAGLVLGYGAVATDDSRNAALVLGSLMPLPALLVVTALAFLLVAWLPRWSLLAWLVVAWVLLVAFLGDTLDLPDAARSLSPFQHLPDFPTDDWTAGSTLALVAIAAGCTVLAYVGYRRRDVG